MAPEDEIKGNRSGQLSPLARGCGPLWVIRTEGLEITREEFARRTGISRASIETAERTYSWPKRLKVQQAASLREITYEALAALQLKGQLDEKITRWVREIGVEVKDGRPQLLKLQMKNYVLDYTDQRNPDHMREIEAAFEDFDRLDVINATRDRDSAIQRFYSLSHRCGFCIIGHIFRDPFENTVRPYEETYYFDGMPTIGRCYVRANGLPIDGDSRSLILRELLALELNIEFYYLQIRYISNQRECENIYIAIPRSKRPNVIAAAKARKYKSL